MFVTFGRLYNFIFKPCYVMQVPRHSFNGTLEFCLRKPSLLMCFFNSCDLSLLRSTNMVCNTKRFVKVYTIDGTRTLLELSTNNERGKTSILFAPSFPKSVRDPACC